MQRHYQSGLSAKSILTGCKPSYLCFTALLCLSSVLKLNSIQDYNAVIQRLYDVRFLDLK